MWCVCSAVSEVLWQLLSQHTQPVCVVVRPMLGQTPLHQQTPTSRTPNYASLLLQGSVGARQ